MYHLPFDVRPFSVGFVLAVLLADPLTKERNIYSKKDCNINLVSTIILASKRSLFELKNLAFPRNHFGLLNWLSYYTENEVFLRDHC